MRFFFIVGAVLMTCTNARGQVNIESYRSDETLTSSIGLSGGGAAGNSEYFTTGATARLAYQDSTHDILLVGNGLIGFAGGKSFNNDGLAHLRYTRIRHPRVQPETFLQSDYNEQRLLTLRFLVGGGVRTAIADAQNLSLYIGNALMFEHERLDLPANPVHPSSTSVLRSTNYVNLSVGRIDQWRFSATAYVQPRVSDIRDLRILASGTLSSKLFGPLAQTVNLRFRHDSRPPDGAERNDLSLTFGIEWRSGDRGEPSTD